MSARVIAPPRRRPPPPTTPKLLQTLQPSDAKVVTLAWSVNGQYLAAGLQHGPILLFAVLPTASRPLRPMPLRTFRGHTADVLQLTFSPTQFLASASMDRSIRLWHPHTAHCLRRLAHTDMVTAVAFKPTDDAFLMSAGCDGVARLWRLADQSVVAQCHTGSVVSAAAFLPSGEACLGTYDGRVLAANLESPTATAAEPDGSTAPTATAGVGRLPPPVPVRELVEMRRARGRRKPGACKVSALLSGVRGGRVDGDGSAGADAREPMVVATRDGRVVTVATPGAPGAPSVPGRPLRVATGRREGTWLGGSSLSSDGTFLIVDGIGGAVRLADLRALSSTPGGASTGNSAGSAAAGSGGGGGGDSGGRRRERELVAGMHIVMVMPEGAVSCAAFAGEAVVDRCSALRERRGTVAMAVGGDDGSLRIVEVDRLR